MVIAHSRRSVEESLPVPRKQPRPWRSGRSWFFERFSERPYLVRGAPAHVRPDVGAVGRLEAVRVEALARRLVHDGARRRVDGPPLVGRPEFGVPGSLGFGVQSCWGSAV